MKTLLSFVVLAFGLCASAFAQEGPPTVDWNKFGIDLATVVIPVVTLFAVYYFKAFLVGKPVLLLHTINFALNQALVYLKAYADNGTFDPFIGFLLAAATNFIAQLIISVGADSRVKKILHVPGAKALPKGEGLKELKTV